MIDKKRIEGIALGPFFYSRPGSLPDTRVPSPEPLIHFFPINQKIRVRMTLRRMDVARGK